MKLTTSSGRVRAIALATGALVICAAAIAFAAGKLTPFSAPSSAPTRQDFLPKFYGEEWYSESYSFSSTYDDGSRSYIQFVVTNLGIGDKLAAVTMSYDPADGKGCGVSKDYDSDEWKSASDSFELTMGKNKLSGDEAGFKIYGEDGNNSFSLSLVNTIPPWRPKDGKTKYGPDGSDGGYDFMLLAPRATTDATIKCGNKSFSLKGITYGDHSVLNFPAYKHAKNFVRLRAYTDDYTVLMSQFTAPKDYGYERVGWLVVGYKNKIVMESFRYAFDPTDSESDSQAKRFKLIKAYSLEAKTSNYSLEGTVQTDKLLSRYSYLAKMPALKRAVVSKFVDPMAYTWKNKFKFTLTQGGASVEINGEGISEQTYINP